MNDDDDPELLAMTDEEILAEAKAAFGSWADRDDIRTRWYSNTLNGAEMTEQDWRNYYQNPSGVAVCQSPQWLLNGCPKCGGRQWQVTRDCWAYCHNCNIGIPTDYPFTDDIVSNLEE